MPKASIIKDIIKEKGGNISVLERELGFGKAGLYKAIERNSDLKTDKVDKLLAIYPDLSPAWLHTGEGDMIIHNTPPPPTIPEEGKDYRLLYETALEVDNKKIHALSDAVLDLVNGVKKDLVSLKNELRYYAQTQTDNQKVLHTGMQNLLAVFFPDQQPLGIVDNKSFLQGGPPPQGSNPESEGN